MKKILFVCLGNICRSPMAEFILKDMAEKAGKSKDFFIASAAVSREEEGNPVYPPARRELAAHGISCAGKTARQITRQDCQDFDYIYYMDSSNGRRLRSMFPGKPSSSPFFPGMWQTPGTPGTFRPPTGTLQKAASGFWRNWADGQGASGSGA